MKTEIEKINKLYKLFKKHDKENDLRKFDLYNELSIKLSNFKIKYSFDCINYSNK